MEAPQGVFDLAWWLVSGSLLGAIGIIIALLGFGGKRALRILDDISQSIGEVVRVNNQQTKAIVELQTRCKMYHKEPVNVIINEP